MHDTTFEPHYSIADLAKRWGLGRETIRVLVRDEPGVIRVRLGAGKAMTRYSVPESVARRLHTKLLAQFDLGPSFSALPKRRSTKPTQGSAPFPAPWAMVGNARRQWRHSWQ